METFLAFLNLTPGHIKAARALLDWNQEKLADASGLAMSTIKRLEGGGIGKASIENIEKISSALEGAGIVFLAEGDVAPGGLGVRLKGGVDPLGI